MHSVKMASRIRRVITLDQKPKIIDNLKEGKSQRLIGDIQGVPKSTVGDIWKDLGKIEKYMSTSDCPTFAKKRCIVREAKLRNWRRHATHGSCNSALRVLQCQGPY